MCDILILQVSKSNFSVYLKYKKQSDSYVDQDLRKATYLLTQPGLTSLGLPALLLMLVQSDLVASRGGLALSMAARANIFSWAVV